VAALQLHRGLVSVPAKPRAALEREVALVDLVDRLLGEGVVIAGDITLSVADVDLVYVGLRALITSVGAAEEKGLLGREVA
jgi:hypothetical protein